MRTYHRQPAEPGTTIKVQGLALCATKGVRRMAELERALIQERVKAGIRNERFSLPTQVAA